MAKASQKVSLLLVNYAITTGINDQHKFFLKMREKHSASKAGTDTISPTCSDEQEEKKAARETVADRCRIAIFDLLCLCT